MTGQGPAAQWLRVRLAEPLVHVLPFPMAPVRLDLKSDFLLDFVAREAAHASREHVDTAYERDEDDAPAEVRNALKAHREAAELTPYGFVH